MCLAHARLRACPRAAGAGVLLALAAPGAAPAQPADTAAVTASVPALTGRWATLRRMPTEQRERWALNDDFAAGRVEPLALVAHIGRAAGLRALPVPPGARYHRECSRRLTPGHAVYTFGMEMNPAARAFMVARLAPARRRDGRQMLEDMNEEQRLLTTGAQGAVVARVEAFLTRRGYGLSHNPGDHQVESNVWHLVTRDGRVPPDVQVMSWMSYPQCAGLLPTGPAVVLSVDG